MGPIRKYQGGWKSPAGYPQNVPKKQADCGHHLVVMPKNQVHGQVGKLHPGTTGIGQHMEECEQKSEIFRAQYPEHYIGGTNIEVHPTIAGMMQKYNKKFSVMRIRNVCKLTEVKNY